MILATLLALLAAPAGQEPGGSQDHRVPEMTDRFGVRPDLPTARSSDAGGGSGAEGQSAATRILSAPAAGEELGRALADPMLSAHVEHIAEWIEQNSDALRQAAENSPLYELASQDPKAYNVATYILLLSLLERGQDRDYLLSVLGQRDDPGWREFMSAYARRLLQDLSEDEILSTTAREGAAGQVTYREVHSDRLGSEETDVVRAAGELAGVADEDLDAIADLAGAIQLADEDSGELSIDLAVEGLASYYEEKLRHYRDELDRAIEQASGSGGGGQEIRLDAPEEDRVPEELLPTENEFWSFASLREAQRELNVTALAREYAHHASRVGVERARAALERMHAATTGRVRSAVEVLLSHLRAQAIEFEELPAAASPIARRIHTGLLSAAAGAAREHQEIAEAIRARQDSRRESTRPEGFGDLDRPGVDMRGHDIPDRRGEDVREGVGRVARLPLDERAENSAGYSASGSDPISAGGGQTLRIVCRMQDGELRCEVRLPNGQSISLGPED